MVKQLYATDSRRAVVDTFQRTSKQMVRVRELDNDATAAKVRTRASLPRTNARAQLRFCGELVRLQPECEVLLVGRAGTRRWEGGKMAAEKQEIGRSGSGRSGRGRGRSESGRSGR